MDETYEVILTTKAEKNLNDILDYFLDNVSFEAAQKIRLGLLEEIEFLSTMPTANGIAHELSEENLTYRKRQKWNYRIIFLIDEIEKIVFVTAIQNTKQNPKRLIE